MFSEDQRGHRHPGSHKQVATAFVCLFSSSGPGFPFGGRLFPHRLAKRSWWGFIFSSGDKAWGPNLDQAADHLPQTQCGYFTSGHMAQAGHVRVNLRVTRRDSSYFLY